jgi:hypothetical protein
MMRRMTVPDSHHDDHRQGEPPKPSEDPRLNQARREAEAKALAERLQRKDGRPRE